MEVITFQAARAKCSASNSLGPTYCSGPWSETTADHLWNWRCYQSTQLSRHTKRWEEQPQYCLGNPIMECREKYRSQFSWNSDDVGYSVHVQASSKDP